MNQIHLDISRKKVLWLIVISSLFLTACQGITPHQAYEGPPKSDSEVATFFIPGNYNLLSIDGVKFPRLALRNDTTVKTLPGSHQFIIEYQNFWDLGGGEFEKITSKPFAVTFTTKAGIQYSIKSAPLESVEQAKNYAEKPIVSIFDSANKQPVSAEFKYNLYGKGLFTTLFGGTKPEAEVSSAGTVKAKTPNKDGKALEMLKYWWETADEKQQGNFRQWLEGK